MNLSVDLDGVLNFYPANWLKFLELEMGRKFVDIFEAKQNLSYAQYKAYKEIFRASTYETETPFRVKNVETLNNFVHAGNKLFIHTSRSIYKSPYYDKTHDWLKSTGLQFSELAFKSQDSFIASGVSFHIDDDVVFLKEAASYPIDINLYLFSNETDQIFETLNEVSLRVLLSNACD